MYIIKIEIDRDCTNLFDAFKPLAFVDTPTKLKVNYGLDR